MSKATSNVVLPSSIRASLKGKNNERKLHYENSKHHIHRNSACACLLWGVAKIASDQSAAGWRLCRKQHGGRAKCAAKSHRRHIQYGSWVLLRSKSTTTGKFNTATGADTLFANTGDQNTATGAGALLSNTTGALNTANGAFTLFPIQLDRATMPLVMLRFSATPLAGKTQPSAISRSTAILRAAATPPTVLARSIPIRPAMPIRRLVWTHSLATPPPAKTQASVLSRSKTIPLAVSG